MIIKETKAELNEKIDCWFDRNTRDSPGYWMNAIIILFYQGKIQICRSRRYKKANGNRAKRLLQHAGGRIDILGNDESNNFIYEDPFSAAKRELYEETYDFLTDEQKTLYDKAELKNVRAYQFGRVGMNGTVPTQTTMIYFATADSTQILHTGEISDGEMEYVYFLSLRDILESLDSTYNGYKWRRCSKYTFRTFKYIMGLYCKLSLYE